MTKQKRQYGTWTSPINADLISNQLRLNDVQWCGDTLVWSESRGKTTVLMAQTGNSAPYEYGQGKKVRGGVGYGGGDFSTHGDNTLFFVADSRLYKQALNESKPTAITPAFGGLASPKCSPNGQWVVYVHTYEDIDGLVIVDSDGNGFPQKLAFNHDFVMQPTWHPDSNQLAYIGWHHPNMPWDGTELHHIKFDDNMQVITDVIITGDEDTAISQPEFSPDGTTLSYISDASGKGQIYLYDLQEGTHTQITDDYEHGSPAWVQGIHNYVWMPDGQAIIYIRNDHAELSLWRYSLADGSHTCISDYMPYQHFSHLSVSAHGQLAVIASASTIPAEVISISDENNWTVHRRALQTVIASDYLSHGQPIEWTAHDGDIAHGLYYAPTNPKFESDGTPPLIVHIHGGPTSQAMLSFQAELQFYASRGFAVLAVNHRGSTGYGREYMLKHRGKWGYYDVKDGISGAQHLVNEGHADPDKLVILGGSAGGYTVLQSLVDEPGFYKAGVCKYGISNQFMLVQDTHKFESRYSERMLGALPEAADVYRDRSPLFSAEKIQDAMIIFQGSEDNVVPPNQSEAIVKSLKSRGVTHEYILFEGEGHGFRKPETITSYLNATMQFLTDNVIY